MAKSTKQDPTLELGPSSAEDENEEQGLVLRVPTAEAIFPAEKETEIRADIAKLVNKYTGFKIESKADYETLKKELSTLVKKRTMVDGTNGWRLSTNRIVNAIGAKILSILEPAETLLASIKKQYDDAEAIKAAAIKAAADKLLADRKAEVFALGGKYDGSAYVLGNVEIYPEDLPGEAYLLKIEKMRAEKSRLDEVERVRLENEAKEREAELERQRLAKEAAEKLAADNLRIEQENKALRDQLAALQAEKEKPVEVPAVIEPTPKAEEVLAALNEPTGEPVVVDPLTKYERAAQLHPPRIFEQPVTTTEQPVAKVDPPAATAAPAKFQPMEIDFVNEPDLVHAYQSGGYAFAKAAKAKFPQIGVSDWKALWEEFLAATK